MSKRIVFTFEQSAYEDLVALKASTKAKSLASVVREGLRLAKAYQAQSEAGYTEKIVRNPETNKERTLIF